MRAHRPWSVGFGEGAPSAVPLAHSRRFAVALTRSGGRRAGGQAGGGQAGPQLAGHQTLREGPRLRHIAAAAAPPAPSPRGASSNPGVRSQGPGAGWVARGTAVAERAAGSGSHSEERGHIRIRPQDWYRRTAISLTRHEFHRRPGALAGAVRAPGQGSHRSRRRPAARTPMPPHRPTRPSARTHQVGASSGGPSSVSMPTRTVLVGRRVAVRARSRPCRMLACTGARSSRDCRPTVVSRTSRRLSRSKSAALSRPLLRGDRLAHPRLRDEAGLLPRPSRGTEPNGSPACEVAGGGPVVSGGAAGQPLRFQRGLRSL